MVGCETSFQVWGKLEQYFAAQTKAKASEYKTQLQIQRRDLRLLMSICSRLKVVYSVGDSFFFFS